MLAVALAALARTAAPASAAPGASAEARAEHQRIVRYWTPARLKAAIPRRVERALPARVPTAKPGGRTATVTQDGVAECVDVMSDPRVDGTYINTLDYDCYASGMCLMWGTHVLDGPDGGWDCSWAGVDYSNLQGGFQVSGVCPGTGGFEGLTYVFQHGTADFGGGRPYGPDSTFDGIIYAGPAPTVFATQSEASQ